MTDYDRIAGIYDIDMGRNMAFDDVAFYAEFCREHERVLELGCGNGRILLELIARGREAVGIDASQRMLHVLMQKAGAREIPSPLVCRMDIRALAFRPVFDVVLCPYSLATYLLTDTEFAHMANGVRAALRAGGQLVIDAFVPRPVSPTPTFAVDYRRAYADGTLVRSKRITTLTPEINRIERRYERYAPDGTLVETIEVSEHVRPLTPQKLRALLADNGFAIEREWWNYTADTSADDAQFFAVAARVRQAVPPTVRPSMRKVG